MTNNEELVNNLLKYRAAYYDGHPLISDDEFDSLENKLRICEPQNEYFKLIGYIEKNGETVKHEKPMKSMQKVKNPDDAENWLFKMYNKYRPDLHKSEWFCYYEPKIDGVSGTIMYNESGKIVYMATRGKGYEGSIIPFHNILIKNGVIPAKITNNYGKRIEIRGEFFIPKSKNNEDENKSLRNITSGIIKSKEADDDTNLLKYIAYDVIIHDTEEYIDLDKINEFLSKNGFLTHEKIKIHISDIRHIYFKYIDSYRDEWIYVTDGLVLTFPFKELFKDIDLDYLSESFHHYNMALKPPAAFDYTSLKDIEWTVSRLGNLIPVGIVDTLNLSNVKINRVTLVSAGFLETHKIGKGSTIKVERANDVIPHFVEVAEFPKGKLKLPKICPVCEEDLIRDGDHLVCTNFECPGKIKAEIEFWFNTMGIKGIGHSTISKIVDTYKTKDIVDFYEIVLKRQFDDIFTENSNKLKDNLYNIINNKGFNIFTLDILVAIGIPGVGRKTYEKLGIFDTKSLKDYVKQLDKDLKSYKRVNISVIEQNLMNWALKDENIIKFDKIYNYFKSKATISKAKIKNENGKNVAVTGTFDNYKREDIEKLIEEKGDNYSNVVNSKTNLLINNDGVQMGKYNKALELGIPIISLEQYLESK